MPPRFKTLVAHAPELFLGSEVYDFLSGESEGAPLFHALYDSILDEPVPDRLRAVVRAFAMGHG